jgi:hypothetical protein
MKTTGTIVFVAIGIGLIWWVLDHQVSQADVLGTATNTQLANQLGTNVVSAIGNSAIVNTINNYTPDLTGIMD